ncbi:MAG: hypothetical protein AAF702_49700 [Chloroflexota bacterium]
MTTPQSEIEGFRTLEGALLYLETFIQDEAKKRKGLREPRRSQALHEARRAWKAMNHIRGFNNIPREKQPVQPKLFEE